MRSLHGKGQRRTGIGRTISLALCMTAFGLAEQPWEKPFVAWTKDDASRILTRSPWAKPTATHDRSGTQQIVVRWEDALPIRQALGKMGLEPAPSNRAFYAVAVVLRPGDGHHDWSASRASLRTSGRTASVSSDVRTKTLADGTQRVIFWFPRTLDIGEPRSFRLPFLIVHSRAIEFEVRADSLEIRQSFPLQDLFYLGNFEL
jgi:hypothetical protein